jgi:spore germination protein GerM
MPNKSKKIDPVSGPKKKITPSHVLMIFLVVFGAIIVVGAILFTLEWDKLKTENKDLENKLDVAQNTLSEVNEAKNAADNEAVNNTTTNTTVTNSTKTDDSGTVSKVKIYMIAADDNGKTGTLVGCGDSVIAVTRDITPTTQPLEAAIKELLSIKTHDFGESGLINPLYQSTLQVKQVAVKDGVATIKLTGTVLSGGVCDDPRIVAQLKNTALQFSTVKSVDISVNNVPLDQLF